MQEVIHIGDEFVLANDNIKDISHAGQEITDVARRYKTDVLAVISKGSEHNLVTQYHDGDTTMLINDIAKMISLVETVADTYEVDAHEIIDIIKTVLEKEE